jgi:hypothetical protein
MPFCPITGALTANATTKDCGLLMAFELASAVIVMLPKYTPFAKAAEDTVTVRVDGLTPELGLIDSQLPPD